MGLEKELLSLRQTIEWIVDPEIRARREQIIRDTRMLEDAGSVLLFGPPGTGKTYMAKAVAGTISKNGHPTSFLKIESYEIVSKWLGESERNVSQLFTKARDVSENGQPAIVFIDEIDSLMGVRGEEVGGEVRVRNQFLKEMDGILDKNK